ncbi:hypothetical protein [Kiloniella sp.]|uniref:hypothetical protein n=1 Tax=Kiloniella sp. TaxID=1938587 RepID=UPI003B024A11
MENTVQKQDVTRETIRSHETGYWDARKEAFAQIKQLKVLCRQLENCERDVNRTYFCMM